MAIFCLLALSACASRYGAVTITTIPAGAEVIDADTDKVLGVTPLTTLWKDTSATRQYVALRLKKQGYETDLSHFWLSMRHKSEAAAREEPKRINVQLTKR